MKKLTIVVPCYNEEKSLNEYYSRTKDVLKAIPNLKYNFLFINDGSTDSSLKIIKDLATNTDVNYISFSRNFGKEAAIYAGLENNNSDYLIIMDADLQDPPSLIPKMFKEIDKYDIVATKRVSRKGEPIIRSFFARCFYKIMNKFTNIDIVDGARDYRLMKKNVAESILKLNEYNRFSKGIFQWVGFKNKWLEFENVERINGESSWSFIDLFKYSLEGIVSFTTAPLHFSTVIGLIFSIIAFIVAIIIIFRTMLFGDPVAGWPSLVVIILFVGGVQLFTIGILGQYLAKTYLETKNRPIYLIEEKKL